MDYKDICPTFFNEVNFIPYSWQRAVYNLQIDMKEQAGTIRSFRRDL